MRRTSRGYAVLVEELVGKRETEVGWLYPQGGKDVFIRLAFYDQRFCCFEDLFLESDRARAARFGRGCQMSPSVLEDLFVPVPAVEHSGLDVDAVKTSHG
jgi:hypothetical protein